MSKLDGMRLGWGICASYCNYDIILKQMENIKQKHDIEIIPIMTENASMFDTRFGKAEEIMSRIEEITGNKILTNLVEVEPLGPKSMIDLIVICPCTGNTMAKLANGITDNSVLGAIKTLRRNNKTTILAIASNDILGLNMKNVGVLMSTKDIYFVPFKMDKPAEKPNSMVSDFELLEMTIENALDGIPLQPVIL